MSRDAEIGRWLVAEREELIDELERSGLDSDRLIDELRCQIVDVAIDRALDSAGVKRASVAGLLDAVDRSRFIAVDGTVDLERVRSAIGALTRAATHEHRPPPRASEHGPIRGVGRYLNARTRRS